MSLQDIQTGNDNTNGEIRDLKTCGSEDNTKKRFARRKQGLLYDISTKKEKKRTRGSTKRQTKVQQHTIRQYFGAGDEKPLENDTDSDMDQPEDKPRAKDVDSNTNNTRNIGTTNDLTTKLLECREEELTILKKLKVSATCFQETNKNWQKLGTYDNIKKKLTKVWKKNRIIPSNMPEINKSDSQPGGTATLVMDK
eukprot:3404405-Ditylum_brightwellii.AAC.1